MITKGVYLPETVQVHVPHQYGTTYSIKELCQGRTVVLKLFRRFGCPFTRYEAKEFSLHKKTLQNLGVDLMAVGFDGQGAEEFIKGLFWDGEIYLDHDMDLYHALHTTKMGKLTAVKSLFRSEMREMFSVLRREFEGNFHGDSLQLGGTFIINPHGKILFTQIQSDYNQFAPMDVILDICYREFQAREEKNATLIRKQSQRRMLFTDDTHIFARKNLSLP